MKAKGLGVKQVTRGFLSFRAPLERGKWWKG